jgi:hypothetical protein
MPQLFRAMKRDEDGLPTVDQSASGLGVRPGVDVDVDGNGTVRMNEKGMSVSPVWRAISILRIPKRLRAVAPGARGSNNTFCFRAGEGPFERGAFAHGLNLIPDSATHGCLTPAELVALNRYEADLAGTRGGWQVDET